MINMKTTTISIKILIGLITIAALLCLPYYIVFSDIKSKNQNISVLKYELSTASQKQAYASSLQEAVRTVQPKIDLLNNSIIPSEGNVGFIEILEKTARGNGLEIVIDSLTEEDKKEFSSSTVNILSVRLRTTGSWEGTYRFLKAIEVLPFKLVLSNFATRTVSRTSPEENKPTSTGLWQSSFEVHTLKYK
jgi:Tfp pilus assembly protein PilO